MGELSFTDRLSHAWNAFRNDEKKETQNQLAKMDFGQISTYRQDRVRLRPTNEKSIVASIYNRIAIDAAAITIRHVRLDQNGVFKEVIDSDLNSCLTLEANIDQTSRDLFVDAVISMLEEGVIALVPVDSTTDITKENAFDIQSIRVGRITQWMPRHVKVEVYSDIDGLKHELILPKNKLAIVENPLYSVMNEPNSTLRRLIRKLNLLDAIDDQSGSGKLDLIIQLPYAIKSTARQEQAKKRKEDLENQLRDSQYGVAYIDSTEKVTQLNRAVDNNLMSQIEYLTSMLYSQLGMTREVFEGTADEKTMLNYHNRTIEPILSAFTMEMKRKWLTKTARTQGQSIEYFNNPFRLVPVNEIADIADKFTRNEILSSNEFRAIVGYKPVDDPRADELRNKNINASDEQLQNPVLTSGEDYEGPNSYYEEEPEYELPDDIDPRLRFER